MKVVLKRSAREQKPKVRAQLPDPLACLAIFIFYFVGLVNDNVLPFEFEQCILANSHSFVCRNAHVEVTRHNLIFNDFFSGLLTGYEVAYLYVGTPPLELRDPVSHH